MRFRHKFSSSRYVPQTRGANLSNTISRISRPSSIPIPVKRSLPIPVRVVSQKRVPVKSVAVPRPTTPQRTNLPIPKPAPPIKTNLTEVSKGATQKKPLVIKPVNEPVKPVLVLDRKSPETETAEEMKASINKKNTDVKESTKVQSKDITGTKLSGLFDNEIFSKIKSQDNKVLIIASILILLMIWKK